MSPCRSRNRISSQASALREALVRLQATVQIPESGVLAVPCLPSEQIGEIALAERIVLSELTPLSLSLEQAFMRMTGETVDFHAMALPDRDEAA